MTSMFPGESGARGPSQRRHTRAQLADAVGARDCLPLDVAVQQWLQQEEAVRRGEGDALRGEQRIHHNDAHRRVVVAPGPPPGPAGARPGLGARVPCPDQAARCQVGGIPANRAVSQALKQKGGESLSLSGSRFTA